MLVLLLLANWLMRTVGSWEAIRSQALSQNGPILHFWLKCKELSTEITSRARLWQLIDVIAICTKIFSMELYLSGINYPGSDQCEESLFHVLVLLPGGARALDSNLITGTIPRWQNLVNLSYVWVLWYSLIKEADKVLGVLRVTIWKDMSRPGQIKPHWPRRCFCPTTCFVVLCQMFRYYQVEGLIS